MATRPILAQTSVKGKRGAFSIGVKNWVNKTNKKLDRVVQYIEEQMFAEIVYSSPHDTGLFRGNWRVSIGSVNANTYSTLDYSGKSTVALGKSVIKSKPAGSVTYMINNLPYARALEYGWSGQAPQGMVRLAVAKYGQIVRDAVALNK